MNKKVLITGSCGFIGYHLSLNFLKQNFDVYGIDNLNNYYDVKFKIARKSILNKYKKFHFSKIDLKNEKALKKFISNKKFKYVIHLAAQAGVRYSFQNPKSYIDNNIIAYFNLIELVCKKIKPQHFVYASSSSVYANTKKYPFRENFNTDNQINLYGATKKCNEIIASSYAYSNKIPMTALRFTVYGPFGRPDMALFKFLERAKKNKPLEIYNRGEHYRDFTYVDDIIESINKILLKRPSKLNNYHQILNIGSSNPVYLKDVISLIKFKLNKKINIMNFPMQKGDIFKTYSSTSKLRKLIIKSKFTNFRDGFDKFYDWYINKKKTKY